VIIPIEKSFLYVEPVYLSAEGANIPQLKRVIVTAGSKVVMEPTLAESLKVVFGAVPRERPAKATPERPQLEELSHARELFKRAEEASREGKWGDFGKAMEELKTALNPPADK
jgi:hypothetical protein